MKDKEAMTKREKDVYNFVVMFRNEKHFSPSMRKIAEGLGVKFSLYCFGSRA